MYNAVSYQKSEKIYCGYAFITLLVIKVFQ